MSKKLTYVSPSPSPCRLHDATRRTSGATLAATTVCEYSAVPCFRMRSGRRVDAASVMIHCSRCPAAAPTWYAITQCRPSVSMKYVMWSNRSPKLCASLSPPPPSSPSPPRQRRALVWRQRVVRIPRRQVARHRPAAARPGCRRRRAGRHGVHHVLQQLLPFHCFVAVHLSVGGWGGVGDGWGGANTRIHTRTHISRHLRNNPPSPHTRTSMAANSSSSWMANS